MSASTIRIVALGKTGTGKSSLANTIFGETVFKEDDTAESGTVQCKARTASVNERNIMWVDTPGFFDTRGSDEELKKEIMNCIKMCKPGPHVFIIVLKVEKYTKQEEECVERFLEYFSEEALKYTTVVFTHGDQLRQGDCIKTFVGQNAGLRDLVKRCGGCPNVIDNKYWKNNQEDNYRNNQFQREELLKTVDDILKAHKGRHYTNELLRSCESGNGFHPDFLKTLIGLSGAALLALFLGATLKK